MKRNDYSRIRSFAGLRMARQEGDREMKRLEHDIRCRFEAIAESLSPKVLLNGLLDCVSPFYGLYKRFFK